MFIKIASFIGLLVVNLFTLNVLASGNHEHNHTDYQQDNHSHHHASTVGKPVATDQATKTIHVSMLDSMQFEFADPIELQEGDSVVFVVANHGKVPHEFSISNQAEHDAHRDMMRTMPNMVHEDGNTVTVYPGETKVLAWQFSGDSDVVFACNIPGHYEAGMFIKTTMTSAASRS